MDLRDDSFWMSGRYARSLIEITDDLSQLDDGNFWAVSVTFEGKIRLARFSQVMQAPFPFSSAAGTLISGNWQTSFDQIAYCNYVAKIKDAIASGWVYQVNACRVLTADFSGDELASLFGRILQSNPAPFAGYLSLPELAIASASPELFLKRDGNKVVTSPIK